MVDKNIALLNYSYSIKGLKGRIPPRVVLNTIL